MDPKQTPLPDHSETPADRPVNRAKKTARVVCANNNEFWTTQKQFWAWAREGIVTYISDGPLTGKFEGRREKLIIMVNHILLDQSVPEHKDQVLKANDYKKVRKPQYPKRPVYKRAR